MTEALAHVDTAEAQFATVASEEEYESKQRDLQRMRDDIADFEVQLLRLQEEKTAAAAALSACASKIEQEIRRLDVRHVELSAGVEEAALALYCHTQSPQTLSEIRHTTTVRTYINCGCITIWDEAVS